MKPLTNDQFDRKAAKALATILIIIVAWIGLSYLIPPTRVRICNDTNGLFRGYAMSNGIEKRFGHDVYVLEDGGFSPVANSRICN